MKKSFRFWSTSSSSRGANDGDAPSDAEIALWLAGANCHLAQWAQEDRATLSDDERLAAEMVRISRFNNKPDLARALVRTNHLFGRRPCMGSLSDEARWRRLEHSAFSGSFEDFFETGLGLLAILTRLWGVENRSYPDPFINVPLIVANTRVSQESFVSALAGLTTSREELRRAIATRLRPDGLPHSPTALFQFPLVEVQPLTYAVASPWAVVGQLRTGVWARYLAAAKKLDLRVEEWFSAFGYMFEDWCRFTATAAANPAGERVRIILPSAPAAPDEVEDVVVVEDGAAVFFSVKGRLMEAKVAREAVSPATTISWFEKFFFEEKGGDYRGGAARQLSSRIDKLRRGDFDARGIERNIPVLPVVVAYDTLGESDLMYRWLEDGCRSRGLLQQAAVKPLALARVEEFEQLLSRVARAQSISELLNREGVARYRRLDQLLYEAEPPAGPPRLPFFEPEFNALTNRIRSRFSRAS